MESTRVEKDTQPQVRCLDFWVCMATRCTVDHVNPLIAVIMMTTHSSIVSGLPMWLDRVLKCGRRPNDIFQIGLIPIFIKYSNLTWTPSTHISFHIKYLSLLFIPKA
jgi:hypothetical protein